MPFQSNFLAYFHEVVLYELPETGKLTWASPASFLISLIVFFSTKPFLPFVATSIVASRPLLLINCLC